MLMKLGREGFSFDEILLQTIANNTCICIYLNPVILVVFLLTDLFAVGYQVSDKRPLGLLNCFNANCLPICAQMRFGTK